jgi:enamine deaminase RidA (YjgF/YER057c/UK114 family)
MDYDVKDYNGLQVIEIDGEEWTLFTDEEANKAVKSYIEESLWAFNKSFLSGQTGLPEEVFSTLQQGCESSNDAILSIVEKCGDMDTLVSDAVSSDGRGHFLSPYDGHEKEWGDLSEEVQLGILLAMNQGDLAEEDVYNLFFYRTN